MPISGKYDFPGIKKLGAAGLKVALASSPSTAWILKGGKLTDIFLEFLVNYLANKGLIIFNLGAIVIGGDVDQSAFDKAMDEAFKKIETTGGKMTPEQMKAIDDEVINAFRKFAVFSK